MKILAYIRVSTVEQASNGDSLATQRQQVAGYAMMNGWEIGEIFVEAGVSGSIPLAERPEGARLLAAAGKGDIVITSKLDRMFRSAADALATLEALKLGGIGLHMIDLGGDVVNNGVSKLVFTILSAVAESERDRLRQRIKEVKAHLRTQNAYAGGKPPYGWDVVDGRLVENPKQQEALAEMRIMRSAGQSYEAIAKLIGKDKKSVARMLQRAE
ncbi:Serine recombinase PinR [Labrys miyagiensis]